MKPIHHWLASISSWGFAIGINQVLFAWLITIELGESASRLGYAQVAMTLPSTLFVLFAGAFADIYGGRRIAVGFQLITMIAPAALLVAYWQDSLTFNVLIAYALLIGTAQAFVLPARDGLATLVAKDNVQRAVVLATLMQFGFQMVGFTAAGLADRVGPAPLLVAQMLTLLLGAYFLTNVRAAATAEQTATDIARPLVRSVLSDLVAGARIILGSKPMRSVLVLNFSMGVFFMGSYMVALPILVRDVYGGNADDIALVNIVNSLGFIFTLVALVRIGNLERPGRALLLSQLIGGTCYALAGFEVHFGVLLALLLAWGACGGVALSMGRTLAQTLVAENMRARAMSFYILSFTGAAPIGALLSGWLADSYGAPITIRICAAMVVLLAIIVLVTTRLSALKPATDSQ